MAKKKIVIPAILVFIAMVLLVAFFVPIKIGGYRNQAPSGSSDSHGGIWHG